MDVSSDESDVSSDESDVSSDVSDVSSDESDVLDASDVSFFIFYLGASYVTLRNLAFLCHAVSGLSRFSGGLLQQALAGRQA
ncbi:MAG: hypothetical protein PHG44_07570 [Lentisphaeria bacterium]|nr:hypothetical protein [Lentisphaeria bacterium]